MQKQGVWGNRRLWGALWDPLGRQGSSTARVSSAQAGNGEQGVGSLCRAGRVWAAEARCGRAKQWGSAGRAWAAPGCTEPHHCACSSSGGSTAAGTEPAGHPGSASARSCLGRVGLPAGTLPYPEHLRGSALFGEAPCQGGVAVPCAIHRCNIWQCCNCHLWRLCPISGQE